HFIHDAKLYKRFNPELLFITKALENPELMKRVRNVLTDGIKSFLKFCIELKEYQPDMFLTLIEDYQFSGPVQSENGKSILSGWNQLNAEESVPLSFTLD
ncbi:MAG: hypothetical protein ACU85E_17945, partial [Gammaproteobacteria bacterium]